MSNREAYPDDLVPIVEDGDGDGKARPQSWCVLVVDDDEDVHMATGFALKNATILGRPIELIHARSAAEARTLIGKAGNIAVALVDVVMETPDAGLLLIRDFRAAGLREIRIILRTGQPGYAPELDVITAYEIDDYRTKAELTRTRLLTVLTAEIRAYDQICTMLRSRTGLEMIVESSIRLFQRTSMELFSRGVLTQIASLLGMEPHGLISISRSKGPGPAQDVIVSATGRFSPYIGETPQAIGDPVLVSLLARVRGTAGPLFANGYMALSFPSDKGVELFAIIEGAGQITPEDLALLKLFSTNIAIGFENLTLVERLDRLAFLDPTLEIPNLNAFEDALGARRGQTGGRMALLSVNAYDSIVASYGQRVAQGLLVTLYDRLTAAGGGEVTVARVGDGSLGLVGGHRALTEQLIADAFAAPCRPEGIEITAKATSVIMDLADVPDYPSLVMRKASAALLHVEQTKKGTCVFYGPDLQGEVERRIMLKAAFKQALEDRKGLAVFLQPKVHMVTKEVIGAEALIRWTHEGTSVSPTEFVPIAESAGLTQPMTEFVVDTVGNWVAASKGRPLPVAINLSMADLNNPGFAHWLLDRVTAAGLTPETLEFEVTEGIAMENVPWAIEQVSSLRAKGFRIALDDFGTGYSSLGSFDRMPIDILKIDQSFVKTLDRGTAANGLAAIVVAMTLALDVVCVAEGVETEAQREALVSVGCTLGQGYLFGRPVPMDEFDRLFAPPGGDVSSPPGQGRGSS